MWVDLAAQVCTCTCKYCTITVNINLMINDHVLFLRSQWISCKCTAPDWWWGGERNCPTCWNDGQIFWLLKCSQLYLRVSHGSRLRIHTGQHEPRFKVQWVPLNVILERDFLGYLNQWEESVHKWPGFKKGQKARMLLSPATILVCRWQVRTCPYKINICVRKTLLWSIGYFNNHHNNIYCLYLTAKSFVELVQYLFKQPKVTSFLSQRICQDPLENFLAVRDNEEGRMTVWMCKSSSTTPKQCRWSKHFARA